MKTTPFNTVESIMLSIYLSVANETAFGIYNSLFFQQHESIYLLSIYPRVTNEITFGIYSLCSFLNFPSLRKCLKTTFP